MAWDPENPWAIHLYTHLMEAGVEAGAAVAPAQKLQYLVPGAPHLQVCTRRSIFPAPLRIVRGRCFDCFRFCVTAYRW